MSARAPTIGHTMDDDAMETDLTTQEDIEIVSTPTSLAHLRQVGERKFGDLGLVKAVVDVRRGIMAIGGGLHVDEQAVLLNDGSRQGDLWGISLLPEKHGTTDWLEFDSTLNLRPPLNRSRSVQDPAIQEQVIAVVRTLVPG